MSISQQSPSFSCPNAYPIVSEPVLPEACPTCMLALFSGKHVPSAIKIDFRHAPMITNVLIFSCPTQQIAAAHLRPMGPQNQQHRTPHLPGFRSAQWPDVDFFCCSFSESNSAYLFFSFDSMDAMSYDSRWSSVGLESAPRQESVGLRSDKVESLC